MTKGERMVKKILLINPSYELEIRWITEESEIQVKADYMPLGLATVAALTPSDQYQVDIYDEFVKPQLTKDTPLGTDYDLVGITSCRANLPRAIKIAKMFREKGHMIIIGGPGVSGTPDRCREHFDVLFIGEAELTWPQFLKDWESGTFKKEYRQIDKPDIRISPIPRWDSVVPDLPKYAMGCVQTTRGCPFDCEFCDVVYLNGRRQRHKDIPRVLDEVRNLQRLGVSTIFFSDDNLVGNHRYAKDFLKELIPLNNSFARPLRYATQASIDTARDDELMELMADANFYQLLIGVETPNIESLKETGKYQNLKGDMIQEIHKVLSYGIVFRAAMVVGFDNDDTSIFDFQYNFIQKSCLPAVSMHMLNAPIGTRLWRRLRAEGRVVDIFKITDHVTNRIFSNILPLRMTRVELMQGFRDLYARLFTWESFKERMLGFIALVNRPTKVKQEVIPLDSLRRLPALLELKPGEARDMMEIFEFTDRHAPFMMGRVKELVIQFVRYARSAYSLIPKLEKQIELEAAGKLVFELDSRPLTIPQTFRDAYKALFPRIHRRAYERMVDKTQVPQALTEAIIEFLIHEEKLETVTEDHIEDLLDLVDNACARLSGIPLEKYTPPPADDSPVPDGIKLRLHDDVIKTVEQEMLKLVKTQAA